MSILQALRIKISYRFLHTTTVLVSILHSLHGLPANEYNGIETSFKPKRPLGEIDVDFDDFGWKLGVIITLVMLGGIFAGLTIGLMGLDETNLQVLLVAGGHNERIYARKVLNLLERGKHWVLVTLLLSNVVVNETLPIIFDSVFGGGWPAVLMSTALIVMFGEIIPQAVCVRHGLAIGAKFSWFVVFLMYALIPVAYPIAKVLDFCLGEQHGTTYRKPELKTFLSLHNKSLNEDEVQIIGSVLDLREKYVSTIMTPLEDVFTLRADRVLDKETTDEILSKGYSRIPVYEPPNQTNFIGMLLVKKLIGYDPEEARTVREFSLSPLPETYPTTSCLDILKFFQEGRSHMVLVSDDPGGEEGAIGIVTLEDVIEELIGEEIIDETDVYVDVHNKVEVVRRPPRQTRPRSYYSFLSRHRNEQPTNTFLRNSSAIGKKPLTITNLKGKNNENSKTILGKSKLTRNLSSDNFKYKDDTNDEIEYEGSARTSRTLLNSDLIDMSDSDHESIKLKDGVNISGK